MELSCQNQLTVGEKCKTAFQSKDDLTEHQTQEHSNSVESNQPQAPQHQLKHKITDVCTKCGKVCQDEDFLVLHMITAHEGMGLPEKDGKSEKEPIKVIKGEAKQNLQCMLCGSTFNSKSSIKKHRRQMHKVDKEKAEPRILNKKQKDNYNQKF